MNLFKKNWTERQKQSNSFAFEFSIPVSSSTWKDKVIKFDLAFLMKGEKYGLFYFMENIFMDYEQRRKAGFSEIIDNYIELLSLRNYFSKDIGSAYKFVGESYINLPYCFDGRMICKPVKYHQPFVNLGLLEFENFPGIDLNEVGHNDDWSGDLYFTIYSSSNIWWEEINYAEDGKGRIYKLDVPVNNRRWAYRITPRLNSMIRDVKAIVGELGGSVLLEDFDKKYVTADGILLDGNLVFQEDLDDGSVSFPG